MGETTMCAVDFTVFKEAVANQWKRLTRDPDMVVCMDVSKDDMWTTYLESFPPGTNEVFRERREHDCNCCKSFIRAVGNVAMLTAHDIVTLWDLDVPHPYDVVAESMSKLVRAAAVRNVFRHNEGAAGVDVSRAEIDGEVVRFNHFHVKIPRGLQHADPGPLLSEKRSTHDVFRRGLDEITLDALETVIELIDQNSLYRGQEFMTNVEQFQKAKQEYAVLEADRQKEIYVWRGSLSLPQSVARVRNSAIGTLLQDLSEGVLDLDGAVRKYEAVVAPTNYKRPKALVTKAMVKRAEEAVRKLGFMDALERRYARTEDITVNNVLFADRSTRPQMKNAFEVLADDVGNKADAQSLEKVEEVDIDTFVTKILPKAESVDVLVENGHEPNFFSLLAPVNADAPCMLAWLNNFSWSYAGEVTDSIKQRVKAAGGSVTGDFRASLAWHNGDDLDLHMTEPGGFHIHYGSKQSASTGGNLDVDMNAGGPRDDRNPVENITYPEKENMRRGRYVLYVHQFSQRSLERPGFTVEVEFDGVTRTYHYPKVVDQSERVDVLTFDFSQEHGLKVVSSMQEANASKEIWNIDTQSYHKVRMIMNSPNHWDGHAVGNRHLFFVLEGCVKPGSARGFYNEFLTLQLREHRKVFEVLGGKTTCPPSDNQISGVGFSSTRKDKATFVVTTSTSTRTYNVQF